MKQVRYLYYRKIQDRPLKKIIMLLILPKTV